MPIARYRVYFDNAAADDERLGRIAAIRVDQGIGMAAEAELELPVDPDLNGEWLGIDDDFVQPFRRVRVDVAVGEGDFVPLIDGPIVAQRFELSAAPDESTLLLVVQDDTVLLNREEKVAIFEDQAAHEIAAALIEACGLTAEVGETPDAGAALTRVVVQRGTNMQLLRELARRHGMFVYVRPGASPGQSVGVFERPQLAAGDLPEILLLGAERNVNQFSAEYDALRPMSAAAASLSIADKSVLSADTDAPALDALGARPAHELAAPLTRTLLARTREEQADLDAATAAAVDLSSWAFSAHGEVDADGYAGVLAPHRVVQVAGAGGALSGSYLISHVTHSINAGRYAQQFVLRRNARSDGSGSGGLLDGVF